MQFVSEFAVGKSHDNSGTVIYLCQLFLTETLTPAVVSQRTGQTYHPTITLLLATAVCHRRKTGHQCMSISTHACAWWNPSKDFWVTLRSSCNSVVKTFTQQTRVEVLQSPIRVSGNVKGFQAKLLSCVSSVPLYLGYVRAFITTVLKSLFLHW